MNNKTFDLCFFFLFFFCISDILDNGKAVISFQNGAADWKTEENP